MSLVPSAMEEPRMVRNVTSLTSSSASSGTDAEWLQTCKPSKRRKRVRKKRPQVNDLVQIQVMLSKISAKCKSGCRDHFRRKEALQRLVSFRKEWAELHKLDQDNVVPQHKKTIVFEHVHLTERL